MLAEPYATIGKVDIKSREITVASTAPFDFTFIVIKTAKATVVITKNAFTYEFVEITAFFIPAKLSASHKVRSTIGFIMKETGIILPTISITAPIYMISSISSEKITVEISESGENFLKIRDDKSRVDERANTEDMTEVYINRNTILGKLFLYGITSINSKESITPRVAKADSHSDTEYTEYGAAKTINPYSQNVQTLTRII